MRNPYDPNLQFIVMGVENPVGYRRGIYFYVMHTATGHKVSRYLRKFGTALRKAVRYEQMHAAGDHYWPAVDRCDELRTNPDAVPTLIEWFTAALLPEMVREALCYD